MDRGQRQQLLDRLRVDAARIADHFGLEYQAIEAEHPRVKSRYGVCYAGGLIKVRLNHAKTGEPLKYSSLVDTLCHELAHLRHFDHGPQFKAFFWKLLGWARRQGIYRPARRRSTPSRAQPPGPAPRREPCRRNGVPIFEQRRGIDNGTLPWERPLPARPLAGASAPSRAARTAKPAATSKPRGARPAAGKSRAAKRDGSKPPAAQRPPGGATQLSLFD